MPGLNSRLSARGELAERLGDFFGAEAEVFVELVAGQDGEVDALELPADSGR